MVNGGTYVLNTVGDCFPMSSTITILDTDEEVIDLDTSQDAITASNAYNNDQTIVTVNLEDNCRTVEVEEDSLTLVEKVEVGTKRSDSESREYGDNPEPLFKVMFRDENVSRKYREKIKEFFQNLISVRDQQGCDDVSSDLVLEIWGEDLSGNEDGNKNINSTIESDDSLEVICENPLFTMSKEPTNQKNMFRTDIPTYEKKYHKTVDETGIVEVQKLVKTYYVPKKTCFNCTGEHFIKDCPIPKNQGNINRNRKGFKTNCRTVRYHFVEDQKFGHMVPGQLSKTLRRALGIKENELPKHIYRMRTLGYPPGWLEEARLQHSGLFLFNSDGLREIEPNEEPGEIVTETDRDQYDIKKIYDFPGYNVPAPPGTHDEYKDYWLPYVQAAHSKNAMLQLLSGKKADDGYKRKKLKLSSTATPNNSNCEPSEMEVVNVDESIVETVSAVGHFVPPLPKDSPVMPPPPQSLQSPQLSQPPQPPTQTSTPSLVQQSPVPQPDRLSPPSHAPPTAQVASEDSDCQSQELQSPDSANQTLQDGSTTPSSRANSPSLFDLESMKKQILVELEDSSSQSNSADSASKATPSATSSKPNVPPSSSANVTIESSGSLNNSLNNESVADDSLNPVNTSETESTSRGTIKSVNFGTPILQSTSPYSKLPSSKKFSKDICDVINFENLPDSTGKYEQMTGVLQKVRNILARIHKE